MGQVRRKSFLYVAAAIVVAIIAGYWVIVELEPFRYEAVSVETPESCPSDSGVGKRANRVISEWKDGTLTIRTSVCTNCAAHLGRVTAQVFGDRVLLKIREESSKGPPAACDCEHPLVVRLAQMPQRDYQIMGVPMYRYCL